VAALPSAPGCNSKRKPACGVGRELPGTAHQEVAQAASQNLSAFVNHAMNQAETRGWAIDLSDAFAELGHAEQVRGVFVRFQRHLYGADARTRSARPS
jgi:hypothetical protein